MKNLLDESLVGAGASGEWGINSGEWVLGSGEWLPGAAVIRRLRYRRRARRLLKRLVRQRELILTALRRGVGLGLAFTLFEALSIFALSLKWRIPNPFPLKLLAGSVVFYVLLCACLALVSAPLLKLRRGKMWHSLVNLSALAMLMVMLEALGMPQAFQLASPFVVALLYLAGLGLSRWRTPRRALPALTLAVTLLAWVSPQYLTASTAEIPRQAAAASALVDGPNVLLIVLDTLRADRLDVMGYGRDTFPWLADFAEEGAVFERAISAAPWTFPSHASMFTGLYPSGHGATWESLHLGQDRTTLAEVFRRHGWDTVALSSNPWISRATGLTQGFDFEKPPSWNLAAGLGSLFAYRFGLAVGAVEIDSGAREVTESWRRWLDSRDSGQPFFAFLNYIEPHYPYHLFPREHRAFFSPAGTSDRDLVRSSNAVTRAELHGGRASAEDQEHVRDLYDAAIRYQAAFVERAVEALRAQDELERTIVVVVADHGEQLGEHGGQFNHNRSLSNSLLSVPLIVRYPARVPPGIRVKTPVTTAALMPTLLDLAGLESPPGIHTRSFFPLFEGKEEEALSPLLSECYRDPGDLLGKDYEPRHDFDRLGIRYRALEEDGWKLIVDEDGNRWLFLPGDDPAETRDLSAEHPEILEQLTVKLLSLTEAYGLGPLDGESTPESMPGFDPAAKDALRNLGYLGG